MKRKHVPALWERVFRGAAYASVGLCGAGVIAFYSGMGWMVVAWAVILLAGFPAAWHALRGRYRGEYGWLPVVVAGLAIYALYEWIETFQYLPGIVAAFLASGVVFKFLSRLAHLHAFVRALREEL